MIYDGRRYTRCPTMGWRQGKAGDVYAEGGFTTDAGMRIATTDVVIFRIKDAVKGRRGDTVFYEQDSVPPEKCIPICAHTSNNVALGVPKVVSRVGAVINVGRGRGERAGSGQPFVEQAHYLVHDGQVYVWKSRRLPKPEDVAA